MRDLLDSPHVDIRRIDNRSMVAGYCAKYCAKGTAKFGTCRRYWMSQDYDIRVKPPKHFKIKNDPYTEVIPSSLTKFIAVYEGQRWTCEYHSAVRVTLRPPTKQKAREGPT